MYACVYVCLKSVRNKFQMPRGNKLILCIIEINKFNRLISDCLFFCTFKYIVLFMTWYDAMGHKHLINDSQFSEPKRKSKHNRNAIN